MTGTEKGLLLFQKYLPYALGEQVGGEVLRRDRRDVLAAATGRLPQRPCQAYICSQLKGHTWPQRAADAILSEKRRVMGHSFTVTLTDEISSVLGRVKAEITENGGRFEGNSEYGSFDGKTVLGLIRGEYRSSGGEIEITITHKPFIVPYSRIESEIKQYFV